MRAHLTHHRSLRVAVLALVTGLLGACAGGVAEGTITIEASPPIVLEIPRQDEVPCQEELGYDLLAVPSGDEDEGDIAVTLTGKDIMERPGSAGVWDQLSYEIFYDDLTYERDGTAPPWQYEITGLIAVFLDIESLPGAPEDCTKGQTRCTLGTILDITAYHDNGTWPLPGLGSGSTTWVAADSHIYGGLQFVSGSCDEYISLIDANVLMDLEIAHP